MGYCRMRYPGSLALDVLPGYRQEGRVGNEDESLKMSAAALDKPNEPAACEHCGALVYGDTTSCNQCGHFPIKMHKCQHCGCIAAITSAKCWKCGRYFEPEGDLL